MNKYKLILIAFLGLVFGVLGTFWTYRTADYNHFQPAYPQNIQDSVYKNEQTDSISKKISCLKKMVRNLLGLTKYPSFPISESQTISMTKFGFPLINLTKDKCVSAEIRKEGYYQTEDNLRVLRTYIKPGHTVINAGAFIGDDTVFIGKLVGQEGHVFAFEPNPTSFDVLQKNIILNDLGETVTLYPYGVSNSDVSASQHFSFNNAGGATVFEGETTSLSLDSIQLRKVDSLIKRKVDFIFMDAEGYEFKAIEGMKELFENSAYHPVFMEWSRDLLKKSNNIPQFVDKMHALGYKFYKVIKFRIGSLNRVEKYKLKLLTIADLETGHKDVLMVQDKDFQELKN